MKRVVLFLGAGSSKAFGLPLTNEIFPLILEGIEKTSLFGKNREERSYLERFINRLLPGIGKVKKNELPVITEILSLLDHIIINGNTLWIEKDKISVLYYRRLLERAIIEVLDLPHLYYAEGIPHVLRAVSKWIYSNHKDNYFTIISTNYDLAIEMQLFRLIGTWETVENEIDYGVNWRHPSAGNLKLRPNNSILSIYKLHGSMNWLKCDLCDHIYINTRGSIYHQAFRAEIDDYNTCHCGNAPLKSLIIAPSIERDIRDPNILTIWKNSLERLREADSWIIIGYSLPHEDLAIKSMLLRAFNGREKRPEIKVVQKGFDAKSRYEILFDEITYFPEGLDKYFENKY